MDTLYIEVNASVGFGTRPRDPLRHYLRIAPRGPLSWEDVVKQEVPPQEWADQGQRIEFIRLQVAEQLAEAGGEVEPPPDPRLTSSFGDVILALMPGGVGGLVGALAALIYRHRGKKIIIRHGSKSIQFEGVSEEEARRLLTEFFLPLPDDPETAEVPDPAEEAEGPTAE